MKIIRWVTLLTIVACGAALSYAQDGGVGNHIPAKTQEMTSPNFNLTAVTCTYPSGPGSSPDPDCNAFGPTQEVQEYFAGYDQFGIPMNSYQVTLNFGAGNLEGTTVGCSLANIEPAFTVANCLGPGVPVPTAGGPVVLTFGEGYTGIGVTCFDSNPSTGTDPPANGGAANTACLNYSVNAINTDIKTGFAAGLPFVFYYPPFVTGVPPPIQTSGPCTIPPSDPPPLGGIPFSPLLVCGPNSFVLGIGLNIPADDGSQPPGDGTFNTDSLPTVAYVQADPSLVPEPPTLLLVGAAMFGISMLLMKKKAISA